MQASFLEFGIGAHFCIEDLNRRLDGRIFMEKDVYKRYLCNEGDTTRIEESRAGKHS